MGRDPNESDHDAAAGGSEPERGMRDQRPDRLPDDGEEAMRSADIANGEGDPG